MLRKIILLVIICFSLSLYGKTKKIEKRNVKIEFLIKKIIIYFKENNKAILKGKQKKSFKKCKKYYFKNFLIINNNFFKKTLVQLDWTYG